MTPLLQSDKVSCIHGGKLNLISNNGKTLSLNGKGAIVKSDLLNAKIIGCPNNILGVPTPCMAVLNIPENALNKNLNIENECVINAEMISLITTDKGFPLKLEGVAEGKEKITIS